MTNTLDKIIKNKKKVSKNIKKLILSNSLKKRYLYIKITWILKIN